MSGWVRELGNPEGDGTGKARGWYWVSACRFGDERLERKAGDEAWRGDGGWLRVCGGVGAWVGAWVPRDGELLLSKHLISIDHTMRNAMSGSEIAKRTKGSAYYEFMNWQPGNVVI